MAKNVKTNAKKKTTKTTNGNGAGSGSFDAQVATILTSMNALVGSIKALGLTALTAEERLHSMRLRSGEDAAIRCTFDVVDTFPAFFESLAARDGGTDPNAVETQPARDALSRAETLAPLSSVLAQMQSMVADDLLASAQFAKELSVPAYAIGKVLSVTNAKVRAALAPAITFYGSSSRVHAAKVKRTASAAHKAAKKAKASVAAS